MIAVILLVVIWQAHTSPTVTAYSVPTLKECVALATSFTLAEQEHNEAAPLAFKDSFSVSCEMKNGEDIASP